MEKQMGIIYLFYSVEDFGFSLYIIIKKICDIEIPVVVLPLLFIPLSILHISIEFPLSFMCCMKYKESLRSSIEKLDIC